ncbi:MAG: folE [Patescibacteria group bacterium]|nr:folE [Patescibacteria group bacterium]
MTTITTEEAIRHLIGHIDSEPSREGLRNTPRRHEKFLTEFMQPKPFTMTTFESDGYDEMIVQAGIPFYSICEHHLVPFFGHGTIAYIPSTKIVGLSKLARTLDHFSRRLQNQERITTQTARFLENELSPKGVAVELTARHLCMEMRGIQKSGVQTTTSCLIGEYKVKPAARDELFRLMQSPAN